MENEDATAGEGAGDVGSAVGIEIGDGGIVNTVSCLDGGGWGEGAIAFARVEIDHTAGVGGAKDVGSAIAIRIAEGDGDG